MRLIAFLIVLGCSVAFGQDEGAIYFKFLDSVVVKGGTEKFIVKFTNDETKQEFILINSFNLQEKQTQRLPTGKYTMHIQSVSFQEYEMTGIIVNEQRVTFLEEIVLEEKSLNKSKIIKKYKEPIGFRCG